MNGYIFFCTTICRIPPRTEFTYPPTPLFPAGKAKMVPLAGRLHLTVEPYP